MWDQTALFTSCAENAAPRDTGNTAQQRMAWIELERLFIGVLQNTPQTGCKNQAK